MDLARDARRLITGSSPVMTRKGRYEPGYRFARVTICVGLTKRSAISSQISVVTI